MDGVLADVYARFFELYRKETGKKLTVQDVAGKLEAEAFPCHTGWVTTPGFFRSVPVMHNSVEGLKRLNAGYDLVIVSMATEFPLSLTDKQEWLSEYFPFITWQQIVFCGNKNIIEADIMIDDHPKNLDHFKGEALMFTQPHNMLLKNGYKRVNNWDEITSILLP